LIVGVQLPSTLKKIDDNAFVDTLINDLTIPDGVTYIGEGAFASASLKNLIIPNSVEHIGVYAFMYIYNEKGTKVTMPEKFDNDNDRNLIFHKNNWNNVEFTYTKNWNPVGPSMTPIAPAGTILTQTNYNQYTNYDKKTGTLTISEGVVEISNVFHNGYIDPVTHQMERIDAINLPKSLKIIDADAFQSVGLTSLTIPNGVTTIGDNAFEAAQLTSLTIPGNVIRIGDEITYLLCHFFFA